MPRLIYDYRSDSKRKWTQADGSDARRSEVPRSFQALFSGRRSEERAIVLTLYVSLSRAKLATYILHQHV